MANRPNACGQGYAHPKNEGAEAPLVGTQARTSGGVLLTRGEVFALLRVGRTSGYKLLKKPGFPQPFDLNGGNLLVWDRQEILRFVVAQPRRPVGAEPEHLETGRRYRNGKLVERRARTSKQTQGGAND